MENEVKKDSDIRDQIEDSKGDDLSIYFNEQLSQVDDKIDELKKSSNMRKDDITQNEIQRTIKRNEQKQRNHRVKDIMAIYLFLIIILTVSLLITATIIKIL